MKRLMALLLFCNFIKVGDILAVSQMEISIPPGMTSLPIDQPYPNTGKIGCYTGSNQSTEWILMQGKNQQSLCLDTNNATTDAECSGSDISKESPIKTQRVCFWGSQKKVHFGTNTQNFTDLGCGANMGSLGNDPGGYGNTLMSRISDRPDWPSAKYFLGNLDKLMLSVRYSTDSFDYDHATNGCPQGKSDPVAGREPIAFANIDIITSEFDPARVSEGGKCWKGTQFYSVSLYDNREAMRSPTIEYVNCTLPTASGTGSFVNTLQPITAYGLSMALPGEGAKEYVVDVLPSIKKYIKRCMGKNVDFNNFRVDSFFVHTEQYNTTIMSNTYIDPKLTLVYKPITPVGFFG